MSEVCAVCRRRQPASGAVCEPCRTGIDRLLLELPARMGRLERELVAGPGGYQERVTTSHVHSPIPARIDTLSMSGPGSVGVTAILHPRVRRWSTQRTVTVSTVGSTGQLRVEDRVITEWHQELARDPVTGQPIQVADDDQIGVLPPAEWLDSWVRTWRRHFGHHVPTRSWWARGTGNDEHGARSAYRHLMWMARYADAHRVVAELLTVRRAWARYAASTVLGMSDGYGGNLPASLRRDDPLDDEWEVRFGQPPRYAAFAADIRYLRTWLHEACEQDVGIHDFAAELRTLHAELGRVVGDRPDQQWLGRCPASLGELDGDGNLVTRPCGAGLWQDPYVSDVVCPRCHSTWSTRKAEALRLAAEIRRVWPIDRRRRYQADEVRDLPWPRCPTCGWDPLHIDWRDATEPADKRRHFRPAGATCPRGCPDARKAI